MERRPDIGLDSYDRFFPNQDTLPQGGLGNLIALPLQKRARELGRSVFLDERLVPFPDQWEFSSSIRRISRREVEERVRIAEAQGPVVGVRLAPEDEDEAAPWMAPPSRRRIDASIIGPLPESLELTLGNQIYVSKEKLPPALRNRLLRLAAFQNPEFYRAQAMRLATYAKPRIIACAEDHPKHIGLPRGCLEELLQTLSDLNIQPVVQDQRHGGQPLKVTFQGDLRPEQAVAAHAMLAHDTGVLAASTAFGKTVVAAWLIAQRGVNTLVLAHRRQLQQQWVERLSTFLGMPARSIGRVGGGGKKPTGLLDVAVIQSLIRKGVVDDLVANYGHLIVDECHHLSAQSFEQVARQAKAKFVTGLSATVTRKDGHHPIIFMQCGPVRYRVNDKQRTAAHPFEHKVAVRPTDFRPLRPANPNLRVQFHELYDELIGDQERNRLVCQDVIGALREGRSPLVLTERNEHLEALATQLAPTVKHLVVLRGGMRKKELDALSARLAAIPAGESRLLLATGRYVGEGFDDARLDTLFLTLPISWHGTIAQYVGRLHRLYDGKREVRVYDYADLNVPMLARMFDRRCRGYETIGYAIELPGSAVPGWPADVPLPVDPRWKSQYAASVRRLVHDGVDSSLASLFVDVAVGSEPPLIPLLTKEGNIKTPLRSKEGQGVVASPNAEARDQLLDSSTLDFSTPLGADRARSPSEAFLYRRLETLAATAGRFRLNAELPIPFDGWGVCGVRQLAAAFSQRACSRRNSLCLGCTAGKPAWLKRQQAAALQNRHRIGWRPAFRRPRGLPVPQARDRKDALLQENGYLVLRFLAEDVGKYLDQVLDAILRALSHQHTKL
jgi:superfamily II DNA or RNA helicase